MIVRDWGHVTCLECRRRRPVWWSGDGANHGGDTVEAEDAASAEDVGRDGVRVGVGAAVQGDCG